MEPTQNGSANANPTQNQEHKKNTIMAVFSYLGPLIIVPYLTTKDDSFVKFHMKQGLSLFVVEVAVWLFSSMSLGPFSLYSLINLATFILAILGIINAVKGVEKELPLIGSIAKKFNF